MTDELLVLENNVRKTSDIVSLCNAFANRGSNLWDTMEAGWSTLYDMILTDFANNKFLLGEGLISRSESGSRQCDEHREQPPCQCQGVGLSSATWPVVNAQLRSLCRYLEYIFSNVMSRIIHASCNYPQELQEAVNINFWATATSTIVHPRH